MCDGANRALTERPAAGRSRRESRDGGRKEGGSDGGGVTLRATASLQMNYSRVFLLAMVKDERKV